MDLEFLTKDGFIGAIMGAVGTYLFTGISDWQKSRKQRNSIRSLILTDLVAQLFNIEVLKDEINYLIDVVNGDKDELFFRNVNSVNDVVFKSNTIIQYHDSFSGDQFRILLGIFAWIEKVKDFNAHSFLKKVNDKREMVRLDGINHTLMESVIKSRLFLIRTEAVTELNIKSAHCSIMIEDINKFINMNR